MVQELGQTGQLVGGQPAGGTKAGAVPKGLRAFLAGRRYPMAGSPFANAQGFGDLSLGPALLHEMPGLKSPGFLPIFG
jgi:hypothetical protein